MRIAVILDNIRSVHNVGSIFRTADAAGIEKIFCCGITPAPLDRFKHVRPDFDKVALGAEKSVAWESRKTTTEVIEGLKRDGWKIFAIEQAKNSVPYYNWKSKMGSTSSCALVLGTEVDGISKEILNLADEILEIPMHGKKESLNVAVA